MRRPIGLNDFINDDWEEALNYLPNKSFDLIYTDPPYGMNYVSNIPGDRRWNQHGKVYSTSFDKPIDGDDKPINWLGFAEQSYRLLKDDRFMFLHCNFDVIRNYLRFFEEVGFIVKGCIAWNKKFSIGGNLKGAMKRDWEPIVYMGKGKPSFYPIDVTRDEIKVRRDRISEIADWVFSLSKNEKCGFVPTQKPLELCKQVILLTTDVGDSVLDPFAGSATTAIICKVLKRNCFSIEINEDVFNKSKKRLKNF